MGDSLSDVSMAAFRDELEKIGFLSNLPILGRAAKVVGQATSKLPNVRELGRRLVSPSRGWTAMTPAKALKETPELVPDLAAALAKQTPDAGFLRRTFGAGKHLEATSPGTLREIASGKAVLPGEVGRTKAIAEELSRRGWTGAGRITKYVPLGAKGQLALEAGTALPGVARAAAGEEGPGVGEQAGSALGGIGTGILTAGTGMPGLVTSIGGMMAAGHLGRAFDQSRARARLAKLEARTGRPAPHYRVEVPQGQAPTLSNMRATPEEPTNV